MISVIYWNCRGIGNGSMRRFSKICVVWLESDSSYVVQLLSSCSEHVPSMFLGKCCWRGKYVSSKSLKWSFRCPIFLGKTIRLQMLFPIML